MPHFRRVSTGKTNKWGEPVYENVMTSPASVAPVLEEVAIHQPISITVVSGKRYTCKLCGRPYAHLGVFAMHYQKTHKDLPQNKDEWRKHILTNVEV